ncbi:hypothetical protein [Marinagarivorans algicola]|uniref:hypothetical protein n=1 Tax=Marinagarivorans algicola TaxID=1513270 RepID=UPI0006B8A303|nr:hypothetical protein [Marinagarivorans algicola]
MVDIAYSRFVDDQRAQVRCLVAELKRAEQPLHEKSLFCAAVRAAELALMGYCAERTQRRFQSALWQRLSSGRSFAHWQKLLDCDAAPIAYWLAWEAELDSAVACIWQAVKQVNEPFDHRYRQGLLAETSLTEPMVDDAIIATSRAVPAGTSPHKNSRLKQVLPSVFIEAWQAVEAQILGEREQALEC